MWCRGTAGAKACCRSGRRPAYNVGGDREEAEQADSAPRPPGAWMGTCLSPCFRWPPLARIPEAHSLTLQGASRAQRGGQFTLAHTAEGAHRDGERPGPLWIWLHCDGCHPVESAPAAGAPASAPAHLPCCGPLGYHGDITRVLGAFMIPPQEYFCF